MQTPFDPFQFTRPDAAPDHSADPVLALFAEWKVVNAKANERARLGMAAQDIFVEMHGGNVARVLTNWSLDAAYQAHIAAAIGPDPGWNRLEDDLLKQIQATPATTKAGIAARIEVALAYSDFDPDSSVDSQDLPWSMILMALRELRADGAGPSNNDLIDGGSP